MRVQNLRDFSLRQTKLDNEINAPFLLNEHGYPNFLGVFAKISLIKNLFEEGKSLIVKHDFFLQNSSMLDAFWPRRGVPANHGTVRKSALFQQPGNQKRLKLSHTTYVNKRSFTFKIKCCVFQEEE